MSSVEKLYDIQLSLDKEEAIRLIQMLEAFACNIEDGSDWSGGGSVETINLIDNVVSMITLRMTEPDSKKKETKHPSSVEDNSWRYCKGG